MPRKELSPWSFLMSTAHGVGLMVAPVLLSSNSASASTKGHSHAVEEMGLGTMSIPETVLAVVPSWPYGDHPLRAIQAPEAHSGTLMSSDKAFTSVVSIALKPAAAALIAP